MATLTSSSLEYLTLREANIVSPRASTALAASVAITLLALAVFGYVKGRFTGTHQWRSSALTVLIGGVAAAVAFMLARVIS